MEKELLTIKGNRKVLFPDALFLYIEWKGNANPKKDEELADIIDDLDTEYFPSNKKESIAQSLPFLTLDRKSTRLHSSHSQQSRMPSSA